MPSSPKVALAISLPGILLNTLIIPFSGMPSVKCCLISLLPVLVPLFVRSKMKCTQNIPALDFIQKLIVHIPEKHFKMLRYYGIYAKHHKQEKHLRKCISAGKQRFLRSVQDWCTPFCFLSDTILSVVPNVVLLCWF